MAFIYILTSKGKYIKLKKGQGQVPTGNSTKAKQERVNPTAPRGGGGEDKPTP